MMDQFTGNRLKILAMVLTVGSWLLPACGSKTSPTSPSPATDTPTFTGVPATSTNTQASTATNSSTFSATPTASFTPTNSPTGTPMVNTATETFSNTPTQTASATFTDTLAATPTDTSVNSPTNSATNTATGTASFTPTLTESWTPTGTPTNTLASTSTDTATDSATPTPSNSPTATPQNTATDTPAGTDTFTHTPTNTATSSMTSTATNTATWSPTAVTATQLSPGDVAFLAVAARSTTADQWAFTVLKDIGTGTALSFTDEQWDANGVSLVGSSGSVATWVADQSYPAGSVIQVYQPASSTILSYPVTVYLPDGSSTGTSSLTAAGAQIGLSKSGDHFFAFQGDPSAPNFLASLIFERTNGGTGFTGWQTAGAVVDPGYLPSSLVSGGVTYGIDLGQHSIGHYDCTKDIFDTPANLLSAMDSLSNWTGLADSSNTDLAAHVINCDLTVGMPFTPTGTPTDTATNTPTDSPSNTPTGTPSDTASDTPVITDTPSGTATNTVTSSPTGTATDTTTFTPTDSPTNTASNTPTKTATSTATPTPPFKIVVTVTYGGAKWTSKKSVLDVGLFGSATFSQTSLLATAQAGTTFAAAPAPTWTAACTFFVANGTYYLAAMNNVNGTGTFFDKTSYAYPIDGAPYGTFNAIVNNGVYTSGVSFSWPFNSGNTATAVVVSGGDTTAALSFNDTYVSPGYNGQPNYTGSLVTLGTAPAGIYAVAYTSSIIAYANRTPANDWGVNPKNATNVSLSTLEDEPPGTPLYVQIFADSGNALTNTGACGGMAPCIQGGDPYTIIGPVNVDTNSVPGSGQLTVNFDDTQTSGGGS